jgi:GNAT superfamily N-acetyltransferase
MTDKAGTGVDIVRWHDRKTRHASDLAALDAIFFQSSATQTFVSASVRLAFREQWLGRYLDHFGEHALLAVDCHGAAVGYVVGAVDDPAKLEIFSDIRYFQALSPHTARFPAHLHINVAEGMRGQGIGQLLIDAFCRHAASLRAPGVHVVTAQAARNVRFYLASGFHEVVVFGEAERRLVMLGRTLD